MPTTADSIRRWVFLALLALPTVPLRGATFTVTTSSDSGAGSLRQAILDANAGGGSNIIKWSGTGGTIANASALPALTSLLTIDPSSATTTPIVLGDLDIGSGMTVAGAMTWSGTLSGPGTLTKTRPNTDLVLTATNTYAGGTVVSGSFDSTVAISRDNNFGVATSTLTMNLNSRLVFLEDMSSSRSFVLDASAKNIDVSNLHNVVLSGAISGGQFFKIGTGTLYLTGPVSVTGGLGVNRGVMVLSATNTCGNFIGIARDAVLGVYRDSNLGNSFVTNQGGTLRLLGSTTITKEYESGQIGIVGFFDTNGFDAGFTGALTSSYTFIKMGSGTLSIGGDHSAFPAGFRIDQGFVAAVSSTAFGSGAVVLNGGGLALGSTQTAVAHLSGSGTLSALIAGATSYGVLSAGSADLSGVTLSLSLGAYTPPIGSTFTVVASTAVAGRFAAIVDPSGANFSASYGSSGVIVEVLSPAVAVLPGAYDVAFTSLTAHWAANGNDPGTFYLVQLTTDGFSTLNASSATTGVSAAFTGLAVDTTYALRVQAGSGAFTGLGSTSTLAVAPLSPSFFQVASSSVALQWSPNGNPGGASYRVDRWEAGGSTSSIVVATTTAVVTGLTASTSYFFTVGSVSKSGSLSASGVIVSTVTAGAAGTIIGNEGGVATLAAPAGTVTLRIPLNALPSSESFTLIVPASFPAAGSNAGDLAGVGVGVQVDLSNGIEPVSDVYLSVGYRASDATGFAPARFVLARYDPDARTWVPLVSSVDAANRVVTARTPHLSLFQLMQAEPSGDVASAKAFPNPLRPSQGVRAMTFSLLPASARVRVYTLTGRLVKDLTADAAGMASWDGTNQAGREAASGAYFVFIQGAGQSRTMTVAVQR